MSDLIERQAAIDALRYVQHRFTVADEAGGMGAVKWSEDVIYSAAAERVLIELPSVQPERKRGKWVGHSLQNGLYSLDEDTCSVCGHSFYQISETGCLWNYCPNCGAKMEVKK